MTYGFALVALKRLKYPSYHPHCVDISSSANSAPGPLGVASLVFCFLGVGYMDLGWGGLGGRGTFTGLAGVRAR